jgi:hypothetical protein
MIRIAPIARFVIGVRLATDSIIFSLVVQAQGIIMSAR